MKNRLLIDLATNRIIWYTSDLESVFQNDEHSAIAEYDGEMPAGLTLQNCWHYGYVNKEIKLFNKPAVTLPLLETNRTSIRKLLIDKINSKRAEIKFNVLYSDYTELLIYNEAYEFNGTNLSELPWLSMAAKYIQLPIEQACEVIKKDFNDKRSILLATEDLYLELTARINNATTNDELFQVRTDIMSKIESI